MNSFILAGTIVLIIYIYNIFFSKQCIDQKESSEKKSQKVHSPLEEPCKKKFQKIYIPSTNPIGEIPTSIFGVTYKNDDGTNRQELLKYRESGEYIILEYDLMVDYSKSIKVCTTKGLQLGEISIYLAPCLIEYIRSNHHLVAQISELTGGTIEQPTRFCNILIKIYEPTVKPKNTFIENLEYNIITKNGRKDFNEFIALDFETTGLSYRKDKIVEVAAIRYKDGIEVGMYTTLINPKITILEDSIKINGITNKMVRKAPYIENVIPELLNFIGDSIIVAHSASFDLCFLQYNAKMTGLNIQNKYIDTLSLCRQLYDFDSYKLSNIVKRLKIQIDKFHCSVNDAKACGQVLLKCIDTLNKEDLKESKVKKTTSKKAN